MKKYSLIALMAATCFLGACGSGNNDKANEDSVENAKELNKDNSSVENSDSKFAVDAANGGLLEVAMGQLAVQKSQNARIKSFGSMLVVDHTKANNELKALAANKNVAIPPSLSENAQKHVDELSKKAGKEFDKAFIDMMVDDHKGDIDLFEKTADKATDTDFKSFASGKLPTLRMHLDTAKAIHEAMK